MVALNISLMTTLQTDTKLRQVATHMFDYLKFKTCLLGRLQAICLIIVFHDTAAIDEKMSWQACPRPYKKVTAENQTDPSAN